jgi:integrase
MDPAYLTGQRPGDVIRLNRADIRDAALWFTQRKTGKKLRITIEGELAALIDRIPARPRKATGFSIIHDENGQPLTYTALWSRFDAAREAAGVSFQFRDIRAKAATDTENLAHAQKLLGHKTRAMTEHYTRNRKGEKINPLK